jgi:TolA-binding protein
VRRCYSIAILTALLVRGLGAQSSEELAQRQYESGMEFLRAAKFTEALRDFSAVVEAYPASAVADDALLEIARHYLEVARNLEQAQTAVDTLLKKYSAADSAPMAYVVAGRIALARGRQPAEVDSALANFERVPRLFPGTDAVPAAMVARADTLRISGRCDDALGQYTQVTGEYPRTEWAPAAGIGASRCLVNLGRPLEALASLQRAQTAPMGASHLAVARSLATILYRLYLRPPQPVYAFTGTAFGGTSGRLKDVRSVVIGRNEVFALTETGMAAHDPRKGAVLRMVGLNEGRGVYLDREGRAVMVSRTGLLVEGGNRVGLSTPKPDKTQQPVDNITTAGMLSTGEVLIANADGPTVLRFGRDMKVIGPFVVSGRADRLIVGSLDQVALLDRADRSISLFTREGRASGRITAKGPGWAMDEPVDIAFDAFDHIYVLDRGLGAVLVFASAPTPKLVTTFLVAERAPGAFRRATAFAVDGAGRLYIHDDRAEKIQVYQ